MNLGWVGVYGLDDDDLGLDWSLLLRVLVCRVFFARMTCSCVIRVINHFCFRFFGFRRKAKYPSNCQKRKKKMRGFGFRLTMMMTTRTASQSQQQDGLHPFLGLTWATTTCPSPS